MREIVFDTETTGTDHATGDRVIEVGAIELLNYIPTGRTFHRYVNPQRKVSAGALAVHGLTDAFLSDKPCFHEIAEELHVFFRDARLVAHNASFDIGFLNAEFTRTRHRLIDMADVLDSLSLARRKHPGASNSLDALCSRYGIDNSKRSKHGALLDAELLAEVYIELIGGKQASLGLAFASQRQERIEIRHGESAVVRAARPVTSRISDAEREAHRAFVATLGDKALWNDFVREEAEAS